MPTTPNVAYLAQGKLYRKAEGKPAGLIESRFAQDMIDRAVRGRERNEWKAKSATGQIMAGPMLWGSVQDPTSRRIHISGITRGAKHGELIYALDTDSVGGFFAYDVSEQYERRLFHRNNFKAQHLSRHPAKELMACALPAEDGVTNIAVMQFDGKGLRIVTEGDSVDEAPSWVGSDGEVLVYQSAGIARYDTGHFAGQGPYAIHKLDLDRERMETLMEDDATDYLLPRMRPDGALYFIRRPYDAIKGPAASSVLKDVVLFPFRLLWGIVGFLNFFTLMFSGKPMLTAGGPKREGPDPKYMMLWGRMVDAEKAERAAKKGEPAALVPNTWELVRRADNGEETILAHGVISYDLCTDGSVVYTDGSAVYHLDPGGTRRQLCAEKMIEHVIVAE